MPQPFYHQFLEVDVSIFLRKIKITLDTYFSSKSTVVRFLILLNVISIFFNMLDIILVSSFHSLNFHIIVYNYVRLLKKLRSLIDHIDSTSILSLTPAFLSPFSFFWNCISLIRNKINFGCCCKLFC